MRLFSYSPSEFYKKAVACAAHYGFLPLHELLQRFRAQGTQEAPATATKTSSKAKKKNAAKPASKSTAPPLYRRVDAVSRHFESTLKTLAAENLAPQKEPLLFFTSNIAPHSAHGAAPKKISFGLYLLGIRGSIAEALVLKAATAILEELGVKESYTHLNSIGDKDSSLKFARELTAYIRRTADTLPRPILEAHKEDAFLAYAYFSRRRQDIPPDLPRPMEFLTSTARRHLRETLEYLEAAEIPYLFEDALIGHCDCYTHTIFELRSSAEPNEDTTHFARGGRFDELSRKFFRTPTPAVGMVLHVAAAPETRKETRPLNLDRILRRRPRVFFIRLGYAAELKSFAIIEALRRARVPTLHYVHSCPLSEQLSYAEAAQIPYTIIMGQKEAVEGRVIVRHTASRAQETVSIDELPSYFKGVRT